MAKRDEVVWRAGSFLDNFTAAADAVGFENVDIAWGLARVRWENIEDRERFLSSIASPRTRDVMAGG